MFLIIILAEIIIGIFGNGFIAAFYCLDWVKSRKLSSGDLILTCLVVSRILLLGISATNIFISLLAPGILLLEQVQIAMNFLWMFGNTTALWLMDCLSIFYCVKITNCNQPLFLRIKQRISAAVPKLLLGSLLISFVSSVPDIWSEYNFYNCISKRDLFRNFTVTATSWDVSFLYSVLLFSAASFIPFIIFLSSSILLIISLWRHTMNMQQNATRFWDPSTEAHVRAIKCLISCLILCVCNFVALIMMSLPVCLTDRTWTPAISSVIFAAYPSGHSLILIAINPKLKQAMVRILRSIKCQLREKIFFKYYNKTPEMSQSP